MCSGPPDGASLVAIRVYPSGTQSMKPKVFVLVHPAWHGAWFWKKVVPLLREGGHLVFTPTLTGLGERSHLARAEIGLEMHVNDVVNRLKNEDFADGILVCPSLSE